MPLGTTEGGLQYSGDRSWWWLARTGTLVLERDCLRLNRNHALAFCLSMIFSENRYPLFRIMLKRLALQAPVLAVASAVEALRFEPHRVCAYSVGNGYPAAIADERYFDHTGHLARPPSPAAKQA
jgi:hypothetical protein